MIQGAPAGIWPVTVAGWVTLITVPVTIAVVVFGWGKFFGKLEAIQTVFTGKLENIQGVVDQLTTEYEETKETTNMLRITMWGVRGDNGLASDIRDIKTKLSDIHERNTKIDAIRAREQGAREVGIEQRLENRRREDRIIRGEEE
jgi:hypothetical protein